MEFNELKTRVGKIMIVKELMFSKTENPNNSFSSSHPLKAFFSNFYPFKIESKIDPLKGEELMYTGFSELFKPLTASDEIPEYIFYFHVNADNSVELNKIVEKV